MPLIEITKLTKLYRMGDSIVRALDGVDLTIDQGEFVAIVGPSGSGKSTMMHLLGCLDRPTSGRFVLDNRDVSRMSDRDLAIVRNRKIGFVFQTFNLIQRTTALENVAVPLFYARQMNTSGPARTALDRVGLAHRAGHRPNELSGGERQRVAIARALVTEPLLILADEPTGNLDTKTGQQIMDLFRELNAAGVTIILVTHEMDVALQAKRIVQMRDGKIIADRDVASVRAEMGLRPGELPHTETSLPGLGEAGNGAGAAVATAPVAVARQAERAEPEEAELELAPEPARGGRLTLTLAVIGAVFVSASMAAGWLGQPFPKDPKEWTTTKAVLAGVATLGWMLSVLLAIAVLIRARGARRHAAESPVPITGLGRIRLATWLGGLTLVAPFAIRIAQVAMKVIAT